MVGRSSHVNHNAVMLLTVYSETNFFWSVLKFFFFREEKVAELRVETSVKKHVHAIYSGRNFWVLACSDTCKYCYRTFPLNKGVLYTNRIFISHLVTILWVFENGEKTLPHPVIRPKFRVSRTNNHLRRRKILQHICSEQVQVKTIHAGPRASIRIQVQNVLWSSRQREKYLTHISELRTSGRAMDAWACESEGWVLSLRK